MIRTDLKDRRVSEEVWYNKAATSRAGWQVTYRQASADTTYKRATPKTSYISSTIFGVSVYLLQRKLCEKA